MNEGNMSVCNIDDISTIKQEKYYYCGAACIQMCLGKEESQDEIYNELHNNTIDKEQWYAEPDAVYHFLKEKIEIDRTSDSKCNSKEATEKILSSLVLNNGSGPMLVSGGKHWVMYSGYQINDKGKYKGIYVRDPWPSAAKLTFYPFSEYFFNEYFCKIDVEGSMHGKVESFVKKGTKKIVDIELCKKPQNGGIFVRDIACFKNDIIASDLAEYGFNNVSFIKNGGAMFKDCYVKNTQGEDKFLLSFLVVDADLSMVAMDLEKNMIIGVTEVDLDSTKYFDKYEVKKYLNSLGIKVDVNEITYIYDKSLCPSCFSPLIRVKQKFYYMNMEACNIDQFALA